MSKVLLINPPVFFDKESTPVSLDSSFPPLGLLYLAAVLEKEKISVSFIDVGATKETLKQILKKIDKEKPILIGISAMTPTIQGAVTIAKTIKEKYKNKIKVCLGGPHVSADSDFIKRMPYFDFGIKGEGEITFLKAVKDVLNHKKVSGVIEGVPEHNLNKIPWPSRHLINHNLYLTKASLIATRGCPFNCYYCSRPAVSNIVRCRDPKDIVAEMEALHANCKGEYLFQDDSLTINRDHTVELCKEMLASQKKFHWAGYTRVDLVDEQLLALMAKAGCFSLTFGIESGDEKLRNEIVKKHFTNKQIIKIVNLCNKFHIDADGFFIFGHPTETKKQLQKTIDFILNNNFNIVGVSIATPFPGSKLWDYAVEDKVIDFKFIDQYATGQKGEGYAGIYPVYHSSKIEIEWIYEKRRYIMRHFYLRPTYILKRLIKDFTSISNLKRDYTEAINLLLKGSSARSPYKKEKKYL